MQSAELVKHIDLSPPKGERRVLMHNHKFISKRG
jgi:hypothetical protein